jgi:hypothetical protein
MAALPTACSKTSADASAVGSLARLKAWSGCRSVVVSPAKSGLSRTTYQPSVPLLENLRQASLGSSSSLPSFWLVVE